MPIMHFRQVSNRKITEEDKSMFIDTGILFLRVLVGVHIAAHGSQKLFGWFGLYRLKGTGGYFETLGFRPGVVFAAMACLNEFVGGLLLTLGLLTPLGAAWSLSR